MALSYNQYTKAGLSMSFSPGGAIPVDLRCVVQNHSDIFGTTNGKENFRSTFVNEKGVSTFYEGMIVYVEADKQAYILAKNDQGTLEFKELGGTSIDTDELDQRYLQKSDVGNIFKFAGSFVDVLSLPTPSVDLVGKVYNIRNPFNIQETVLKTDGTPEKVTDANGIESLKLVIKSYPAGTNVVCYEFKYTLKEKDLNNELKDVEHTDYRWDALGGVTEWDWEEV